jgi:hypothetical protein
MLIYGASTEPERVHGLLIRSHGLRIRSQCGGVLSYMYSQCVEGRSPVCIHSVWKALSCMYSQCVEGHSPICIHSVWRGALL